MEGKEHGHDKDRDELLRGMHLGKNQEFADRIVETNRKVRAIRDARERLRAAMLELIEDTRALVEEGDKNFQVEALAAIEANLEHWMDMVLTPVE